MRKTIIRMYRSGFVLLAVLALLAPTAAEAKKKGPSRSVVQKKMVENYIGSDATSYPTTRYSLKVNAIKRGAPRKGNHRADGVPANTNTTVFPLKVTMTYIVCYQDGTARRDKIVDKQVWFKDDFGEWDWRLQSQQRTQPPADNLASCPM